MNLKELMEELKVDIIQRHIDEGQRTTGKTMDSFKIVEVTPFHMQLVGNSYAYTLQYGRSPGVASADFREIIYRWSEAKGIQFETEEERGRFAYFVAKKIQKEGTKLYRSGNELDIFKTAIDTFTENLKEELKENFKTQVLDTIYNR